MGLRNQMAPEIRRGQIKLLRFVSLSLLAVWTFYNSYLFHSAMVYSKKWQSQFTPYITVIGLTPRADSIKIFGVHLLSSKSFITMEKIVNRYTIACLKKRVYVLQKKFKRLALSYIEVRREQKVLFLSHQVTRHTTFFIGTIIWF